VGVTIKINNRENCLRFKKFHFERSVNLVEIGSKSSVFKKTKEIKVTVTERPLISRETRPLISRETQLKKLCIKKNNNFRQEKTDPKIVNTKIVKKRQKESTLDQTAYWSYECRDDQILPSKSNKDRTVDLASK